MIWYKMNYEDMEHKTQSDRESGAMSHLCALQQPRTISTYLLNLTYVNDVQHNLQSTNKQVQSLKEKGN